MRIASEGDARQNLRRAILAPKTLRQESKSKTMAAGEERDMTSRYAEVYAEWRADPQAFWAKAAQEIDWIDRKSVV